MAAQEPAPVVVLPEPVRQRVVAVAAEHVGALAPEDVPAPLRAVARFTPGKRARLGALALAAALETDDFREQVAERVRAAQPELTDALEQGRTLPAAAPEDVAAAAYLFRSAGWQEHLARVAELEADRAERAAGAERVDVERRLTEQLAAARAAARNEVERVRTDLAAAQQEVTALRRRVRELGDRAGRAEAAQRAAERVLQAERVRLERERGEAEEQRREVADRLAEADRAVAAARSAAREGRQTDELRLRVLLDALLGAAGGLRRELALPPLAGRPADAVVPRYAPGAPPAPPPRGREPDDPALLDALLGAPLVHLLVDGYNVTKAGFGELSLEAQRTRLLSGLGALAARTRAEVTVVFDGGERVTPIAAPAPRGVRLLFSRDGETADDVLRHLVRFEPAGRPLVVVSSDREVADDVRDAGAHAVPSAALLRLLARG